MICLFVYVDCLLFVLVSVGQLAMGFDKRQLYDTDIRIPYFVRPAGNFHKGSGPVPRGVKYNDPISHVDLAPTRGELVTGSSPETWDGLSYAGLLDGSKATGSWKKDNFL